MTTSPSTPDDTAYDWLTREARSQPSAIAVATWRDGAVRESLDFTALSALVERAAAAMARHCRRPGDRVVLALPNDITFTAALLACMASGLIAVPAPEVTAEPKPAVLARLRGIVEDCRPTLVIVRARTDGCRTLLSDYDGRFVAWDDLIQSGGPRESRQEAAGRCAVALLQYTSGSTGKPKGAILSHQAVRANCRQVAQVYQEGPHDTAVTWVPLHHDMGLVTGVLRPLFSGYTSVLLRPRDFVRAPLSWLQALTTVRGTLSSAPDFGYGLCVRRVPAEDVRRLDLGSWRVARNAGETVRANTADRFTAHFSPAGFRPEAFCPSYGMAEATLTVATGTPDEPSLRLEVDRAALRKGRVVPSPAQAVETPSVLLSSGRPLPGTEVTVGGPHDDRTTPPGRTVGRISIRGPQMFSGYWSASVEGSDSGTWHDTGDIGFMYRRHLFVVGRDDDTIIQNGRNFYAVDIRAICDSIEGIRPGRCVVLTADDHTLQTPDTARICMVAEVYSSLSSSRTALAKEVRRRLADELELFVHDVELISHGELPITTSGKPQINEIRSRFTSR
ncbi:AMP-binding protein [Streptomyces sp. NPDC088348]|uniref:AMP-binding protein n=1 Tax=Streptomyces sp. NPDC088348 TaxID=3365853 RepID=UPI0037FCFD58